MCACVCVCTCARSKLITISPYCNSNIRLVILSEKAWLVISLVVSFRFSRHLFSVINFLHFLFPSVNVVYGKINIVLYCIVSFFRCFVGFQSSLLSGLVLSAWLLMSSVVSRSYMPILEGLQIFVRFPHYWLCFFKLRKLETNHRET